MTITVPVPGNGDGKGALGVSGMLVALACSIASPALALPEDPVNFIVGGSARHESNLFRLSPSTDPLIVVGKPQRSDWVYSTYLGIRVDKPYSLQRFQLDATVTDNRYDAFSYLNYTQNEYRGAWLWSLTPSLTGVLSTEQQQVAASFAEFRNFTTRNIQTNKIHRASVDWLVGGGWHAIGGVYETESKNTASFTAVGDYTLDTAHVGVKYVSRAGNTITVEQRQSRGQYNGRPLDPFNVLDNRFTQSETAALVGWQLSGHSNVHARLGYVEREHANFSARNFRGGVGRVAYVWTPTGKVSLSVAAGRDLYSFQELTNSYYTLDYLTVTPAWAVTAKTTLRLRLDVSNRHFRGNIIPVTALREETIRSAQFNADWALTRTATLSGFFLVDQRTSNFSAFEYRNNTTGVAAQLKF
jgi:exopolysaccharide biosynthesis operon protein EpsL